MTGKPYISMAARRTRKAYNCSARWVRRILVTGLWQRGEACLHGSSEVAGAHADVQHSVKHLRVRLPAQLKEVLQR